jgi:long-chain acyl-CoA synthetase
MTATQPGTIIAAFRQAARQTPDKTALIYLGSQFSYAQIEQMANGLAASLVRMGVRVGDRVMLYLPNLPQWVIAWLAVQQAGAVAVPITPYYVPYDLKYIANDCGAKTIFCMDTNFGYVQRVMGETGLQNVIVTTMVELLPRWKRVVGRILNKVPEGGYALGDRVHAFKSLLGGNHEVIDERPREPKDTAEILYTGGTTGAPKGVPISHVLFLESADHQRQARENAVPRGQDVLIQGGALYHILGQAVGLGALLYGDTVILLARVNLDALFDHIQRYQAKTFFGVPAMYRMILEHDRVDQYDLSSLEHCFSGGDVLPLDVARRWEAKYGQPIYQGYGATETCGGISLTPAGVEFPEGTAGKVVGFQRVRVVDPESLQPLDDGQAGELLVGSEHMVRGYWNNPQETEVCFIEQDGKLWYRTGDILRVDEGGWFYFLDRAADTIKHKGYRVAASKVEAILQDHGAVTASCVVGIPDARVGERIKAFVVLRENVKGVTAGELLQHCRERLAPYEVPHYIEIRDMLPKSKVGKLLRRELRADERRKLEPY